MELNKIDTMISSEDPSQRRAAASLLAEIEGEDTYGRLELLLKDHNNGVRDAAQNAIVLLGGRQAIARMLPLLSHSDPAIRNTAIDILRKIGIDGVDMLQALAKDADDSVRLFVLDILGTIGSHESVDTLIEGLYDVNPNVRNAAVISLGELGDPRSFDHLKKLINDEEWIRFSVIESLARIPHEGVVEFLIQELSRWSGDEITICAILETLGMIGSHEAVPSLLDMLQNTDQYVEFAVARTLLAIMDIDDIASLEAQERQVLKDILDAYLPEAEEEFLYRILATLGRIGDSQSARRIIELAGKVEPDSETEKWEAIKSALKSVGSVDMMVDLLDRDESSVVLGVEMLGSMGGEEEAREISSRVLSQQGYVKRAMTEALALIGGKGSRDIMLELLDDRDGHVIGAALKSLGDMGNPGDIEKIAQFLRHPYPDVKSAALEAVVHIGTAKAEDCFTALTADSDPKIRIMALDGLQRLGCTNLGQICTYMLKDQDWEVRMVAVKTTRDAGLPIEEDLLVTLLNDEHNEICHPAIDIVGIRKITGLRSFLEDAIGSDDMWTSYHAIEALGKFGDESAKSRLLSILKSGQDFLRISAAKTLGEWKDEDLVAELEVFLDDDNLDVARAAAETIDRIQGVAF
jgi:HEAT repeat protein